MKIKIHFSVGIRGFEDEDNSLVLSGDSPEETRAEFDAWAKGKNVSDCWSEVVED